METIKLNINELFNTMLNKPKNERVRESTKMKDVLLEYLNLILFGENEGMAVLLCALFSFVRADNRVSYEEYEFLNAIGIGTPSYEVFVSDVNTYLNNKEKVRSIISTAPNFIKENFMNLCLNFIACDGVITTEETNLFLYYLTGQEKVL